MEQLRYIYVGRLDYEKGVDLIIKVFEKLFSEWTEISLDIFGRWELEPEVEEFVEKYASVAYHWFQKKNDVLEVWSQCDFCIMPSRFLETFWLTALDSLSVGVPIIAPSQWWLTPFILPDLELSFLDTVTVYHVIKKTINKYTDQWYSTVVSDSKKIYAKYSWTQWYRHSKELWLPDTIILANDYGYNHGWIETFLEEVAVNLTNQSVHISHLVWTQKRLSHMQRFVWLLKTFLNISSAWRLNNILSNNIQLIWWHSVHRQFWWFPLFCSPGTIPQWIMVHDMWLLHPFPSVVYDEQQIVKASTFIGRIQEWLKTKNILRLPLLLAKWISVKLIWRQVIRKKMMVQVPSEYLVAHVSMRVSWNQRIVVLPHFVW